MLRRMSTFLFTLLGLTVGSSDPCAMKREIAPCTCGLKEPRLRRIAVSCEEMPSFADIVQKLQDRFPPEQEITLQISHSHLSDMTGRSFEELGMRVIDLKLNFDNLSHLHESSFIGLGEVEYISLADNRLLEIPREVLRKMPKLKTLDLGRSKISNLWNEDFRDLPSLRSLLLPKNLISRIESNAFPKNMRRMHIGLNAVKDLNGSLRALTDLEWLFINGNQLTTLQQQLPVEAPKLTLINGAHNYISKLPVELRNYPIINTIFFSHNDISSLDGILQKARRLTILDLSHNKIHKLADDDFTETELMDDLKMGYNYLKHLNNSFTPMKNLRSLNLTHNYLAEFSFEEIRGLKNLMLLDLSYNKIARLKGRTENDVEVETRIRDLRLEHNEIKALEKALQGIHGLQKLNLSHNKLTSIEPYDLKDLNHLRVLDISHNHIKTLEDTFKTSLPHLQELISSNNLLRVMERDFHGLPELCKADLSNNQITAIGYELISKTRCEIEGVPGVLRIYLHDNPVLCNPDFNVTADYMEGNFTILLGNFSICSAMSTTAEAPTIHVTESAAPVPSTEMIEKTEPLIIPPQLIINQQPIPYPLLIASQINDQDDKKKKKNEVIISENENAPHFDILASGLQEKTKTTDNISDSNPTSVEGNIIKSVMIHSPVVVKNEGNNVTLFIPVENGAIKKDHIIDHYIQKNDDTDVLNNQTKVSSLITNIDIVEIKQLPNDSPSVPNKEESDTN